MLQKLPLPFHARARRPRKNERHKQEGDETALGYVRGRESLASADAIESRGSCPACVWDKKVDIREGYGKLALIWRYEDSGAKGQSG